MAAVLDDWRTAPISAELRATLEFVEKVTLHPADVTSEDVAPLRAAGVTDIAVREALYVCYLFNIMDRLADSFDFHIPSEKSLKRTAHVLHKIGYGIASIPG